MPSKTMTLLGVLMSVVSCASSLYLVYILFYVLEMICLVCMPVHFINLALFILFTMKWNYTPSSSTRHSKINTNGSKPKGGQSKGGKRKSKKEQ